MRRPSDMPPPPPRRRQPRAPGRGRLVLIIGAVVLFVIVMSLKSIAEFWTDYLWFDSVGYSDIWSSTLLAKVQLGAIFTGAFFALMWANLLIADHISPKFRPLGPEEELLVRYHQAVDRRAGLFRATVAAVFAVITGAGMSSLWNEWLLFLNGGDFGTTDPIFGNDVGFYIFRLPFLIGVVDWLFAALFIVLLITVVVHYLNGGIRLQAPFERVSPQVKAHISVLLALLAVTKGVDYWLQRFQLLYSERSAVVSGATYTEVNAELPALQLLIFIAAAAVVLFLLNIRRRGWVLPIVAVGIWALVQIVIGEAYPAFYQRFIVQPEESGRETAAIQNNIDATRKAYGLDRIETRRFDYSASSAEAAAAVNANPQIIRNIQLLDPDEVDDAFQRLQSLVSPYQFAAVATDRYQMRLPSGEMAQTQVVLANREINADTIPQKSWEGRHLSYTHGYAFALAAGGGVTTSGSPDFAVFDIPIQTDGRIDVDVPRPATYYGLNTKMPEYSIVGSSVDEVGYLAKDGTPKIEDFEGAGGVTLDSTLRRAAFWLRFNDFNLLISNYISPESRVLYMRDVRERAKTAAPFLQFDSEPYPVVVDGRMLYVLDAYTTSTFYPNAQRYPVGGLAGGDLNRQTFNYIRNSVKATVDTYDGKVTFYVVDDGDPMVLAWRAAFPDLFKDSKDMPADLRDHLRYPEDLFRVQSNLWGRYHISDPKAFYDRTNAWETPSDPPSEPTRSGSNSPQPAPVQQPFAPLAPTVPTIKPGRMAPVYVINRMPGDEAPSFMLMRPFQPYSDNDSKNKLTAFMVAKSDPDGPYGQLQVFEVPADQIDGPTIVASSMQADANVSREITFFNQQGSQVRLGELVMVPLERSVLYVRPMYVFAAGETPLPQIKRVIVSMAGRVVVRDTLRDALRELLPGAQPETFEGGIDRSVPPVDGGGDGTTTGTTPGTAPTGTVPTPPSIPIEGGGLAELVARADQLLDEATQARLRGDLETYQQKVDEATRLLDEASRLVTTSTTAPPGTGGAPAPDAAPAPPS